MCDCVALDKIEADITYVIRLLNSSRGQLYLSHQPPFVSPRKRKQESYQSHNSFSIGNQQRVTVSWSPRFFTRPLGSAEGREETICGRPLSCWSQRMLHPPHYIFLIKAPNENGVKQFQRPVVVCVSVRVDLCVYQGLELWFARNT